MINLEVLKQRRMNLGLSYQDMVDLSGLPLSTIQKVFGGITKSPRRKTLETLQKVLFSSEEELVSFLESLYLLPKTNIDYTTAVLKDSSSHAYRIENEQADSDSLPFTAFLPANKKDGEYTVEDYLALPDNYRVELIDGRFFVMDAPTWMHQVIASNITHQLIAHVSTNSGNCLPIVSPVDVQLDMDDKTMVQPDVIIICDKSKLKKGKVYGAPDFVAEILSPSTKNKDLTLKLYKYMYAGVREYWMIDPDKKVVVTYDLSDIDIPVIYPFDSKVPVKIWDSKCSVDFAEIAELIDKWSNEEE